MAGCRGPSTAAAPPLPREESPAVENPSEEAAVAPAGRAGGPFSPGDCLPEFYLYAEFEPSYSGASAADDPHIQALLRAYREEEAEAEQLSADGGGADAAAAAGGGGGCPLPPMPVMWEVVGASLWISADFQWIWIAVFQ